MSVAAILRKTDMPQSIFKRPDTLSSNPLNPARIGAGATLTKAMSEGGNDELIAKKNRQDR
jgi:hypothetical protein